ncbi:MAG TPA: hypothetical protein VK483_15710 [Chitinophagaceae bacterium]|nr:hypothetical protein [Chitinophagaceae bacterium]
MEDDVNDISADEEEIQDVKDIFGDDEEIREGKKEAEEYFEMIKTCTEIINQEFSLKVAEQKPEIGSFEIIKTIRDIYDISFYSSADNSQQLTVLLVEYDPAHPKISISGDGEKHCLLGLIQTRKEFPLTYIYKETLKDRMVDWFVKGDVDFKNQKKFSNMFHVVTKDKEKLISLFDNKPLDDLARFPDLEIEISKTQCLFRLSENTIDLEESKQFILLTKSLIKIFN